MSELSASPICKILVVDDSADPDVLERTLATSFSVQPNEAKVIVRKSVSDALALLNIDDTEGSDVDITSIRHDFDIVLLDWDLGEEVMKDYPMGGLTLHTIFKVAYREKRWPCIVCAYSSKLPTKIRRVFDLSETLSRGASSIGAVFESGISEIKWPLLFQARASTILESAPHEVINDIASEWASDHQQFWRVPLKSLAAFLECKTCSLDDLLLCRTTDRSVLAAWITEIMLRKSTCCWLHSVYEVAEINEMAHHVKSERNFTDYIRTEPPSIVTGNRAYPIPQNLAVELDEIARNVNDGRERVGRVKRAFRMALRPAAGSVSGYGTDDVSESEACLAACEWNLEIKDADHAIYVYIPRRQLATMLSSLESQLRSNGTGDGGTVACGVREFRDRRVVLFVLKQDLPVDVSGVENIAANIGLSKPWGPFPEILKWGSLWVCVDGGAVLSLLPGRPMLIGVPQEVLRRREFALVLPYFEG